MMLQAFTETQLGPNKWRYHTQCPICQATYVERIEWVFPRWDIIVSGGCEHMRGVDEHTDLVNYAH